MYVYICISTTGYIIAMTQETLECTGITEISGLTLTVTLEMFTCSLWGDKYICRSLEVWMFLSCYYLPHKYQVPQNLNPRDGHFLQLPVALGSCAHFTTEVVISKASFTLSTHIPLSSIPSPSTDHSNCCFYSPEVTPLYCLILEQAGCSCNQRHLYCQVLECRDTAFAGWNGHPGEWQWCDI